MMHFFKFGGIKVFNYNPVQWVFLFEFYSFCGWCWESAYVTYLNKKWVNRGFMRGPFLPLYGCGGVMMLVVSKPYYDNFLLVYIAGCIGATLLEYLTGVIMESLFKVRYWDYADKKLNYKGYICLESTLFWGVCTVVFSHLLQIPIEKALLAIPNNFLSVFTLIITAYISCDFMVAFKTALDLRDVLIYMENAKVEMRRMQKRLDVIIAFKGEEVKESIGNKVEGIGGAMEALSNGIGTRLDVLSASLEKSFIAAKEKISRNPSGYVNEVKDEVFEEYTKFRIIKDKITPRPVKNFFEAYRNRTIMGNPGMYSEKFKANLEEIKDRVSNH